MIQKVKNMAKQNAVLYNMYLKLYLVAMKNLTEINPVLATKLLYRKAVGHKLNLKNPVAMTEKMQWLKLNQYRNHPLVTMCADKYRVREFIQKKGCPEILNELYGVWDKFEDIDFQKLPKKFVLKCNHGCGYNLICEDKDRFDLKMAEKKINKWMKERYGKETAELVYDQIERKIICEKFMESEDGEPLKDYKIFCSYGVPKLIYVVTGGHGEGMCLDYYTTDWKWIPVRNGQLPNAQTKRKKPELLKEMLNYAKILSEDFPLVRVDLYCEFGKIFFGELTFLATGGVFRLKPQKYDKIFGEMFFIPIHEKRGDRRNHGDNL